MANSDSDNMDHLCQENLKKLKRLRGRAKLEVNKERRKFLRKLYPLINNWKGPFPDMRQVFRPEEIDWLLSEDVMCYGEFILFAVQSGYKDEPEVDEAGRPVSRRTTAVHHMARRGFSFIIYDLFKIYDRFDVNYVDENGYTHFHAACACGCFNIVEKFLEHGQNPDCVMAGTGDSPLHLALTHGHQKGAELLLRSGANPNSVNNIGRTPLHIICAGDDSDFLANTFFEINDERHQTVLVDAQDKDGNTPLHYTLKYMDCFFRPVAELLLRRGANPNLTNKDGLTALHMICWKGYVDLAQILFDICDERNEEVRIDAVDNLGRTPLHFALNRGWSKSAEVLLRRGADPNIANKQGFTPLHVICHDSKVNCEEVNASAKMFFKFCDEKQQLVEIDAKDILGRTPLDLAVQNLWPDVVETLLNRGADLSNFAFPNENCFVEDHDLDKKNSWIVKLRLTSRVLAVVERLERKGYEVNQGDALKIMKFFAKYKMFKKSAEVDERWYDDEVLQMQKITVITSPPLSLYDLIDLPSEEVARHFTNADRSFLVNFRGLPQKYHDDCFGHLSEKLSRRFFRRWALDCFLELTGHRLPILCCEAILENLTNQDLYRVCLATANQSHKDGKEIAT